ncbi:MAG: hypothetical protein HN576_03735 [Bacteriovoracaceae bacterium]|jgi:hypothetical protein|nr:hypothetical protein [Bacteriovoracaceae bacterium]
MDWNQIQNKGNRPIQQKIKAKIYHQKTNIILKAFKALATSFFFILISA